MRDKIVNEQRLVKRMESYWDSLKEEGASLPKYQKFNNARLQDIWENCFTLIVNEKMGNRMYKYEHVGEEVHKAYGSKLVGDFTMQTIKGIPGVKVLEKIDECITAKKIFVEDGKFINKESKMIKFRSCILPFGSDGENVDHVVTGLSWRKYG